MSGRSQEKLSRRGGSEDEADAIWQLALRAASIRISNGHHLDAKMDGTGRLTDPEVSLNTEARILLLLDMNGTLLHRERGKRVPNASSEPFLARDKTFYYLRPGAKELVSTLLQFEKLPASSESPPTRLRVGFYTSMKESNAVPAVHFLTGESEERCTQRIYAREFNVSDPTGENSWDTHRDLNMVWGAVGKVGFGFNETNTIMVDDTPRKMRHLPRNAVFVPEFAATHVVSGEDSVLFYLLMTLEKALYRLQGADPGILDVRDVLEQFPDFLQ